MAIATTNGKLAVIHLGAVYAPSLPLSPGSLGQDDRQQLLWGFPERLWSAAAAVVAFWCAMTGMSAMTAGGDVDCL